MAGPNTPLTPSITGNPQVDTFLGYAATHLGVLVAGISIAWMNAHGFDTASLAKTGLDMTVLITTTVAGFSLSLAAWIWGQLRTKWSQQAIVSNTVQAAVTGKVPEAIAAKATPEQAQAVESSTRAAVAPIPPAAPAAPPAAH